MVLMRKRILLLLSVLIVSLLLFSCAPKQPKVMEQKPAEEAQEMPEAAAKTVSDLEVEADLKKLSIEELDDLIKVGEADKDKSLSQQAYNNQNWLTLAYKVKAEKLAEQSPSAATLNHAPVFKDFSNQNGAENVELKFTVSATDEDGDTLTYDIKDKPAQASFKTATGKFSWTPDFQSNGTYEVIFIANDGKTTATKTILLKIANTNRPPKFDQEIEEITQLEGYVNQDKGVYLIASDPDGEQLKFGGKSFPAWITYNADSGDYTLKAPTMMPLGYKLTFTVSDGIDTTEKVITYLPYPKVCAMNTKCPAGFYCQEPTSSCQHYNLNNLNGIPCQSGINSTAKQQVCVDKSIQYWTDDTKNHNLCYKVDPVLVLNSCTITKPTDKYKYDCSFTATCDYSTA